MINNEVRQDMANMVQRALNSIWESRIITHATKDNTDIEYLNDLICAYLKLEEAYGEIIFKYKLKVEGQYPIKNAKFKELPRRMSVTLMNEKEQPMRKGYVRSKLDEFYNGVPVSGMSFYLVYNAFTGKIDKNFYREWKMNNKRMKMAIERFYVKNGETFALMLNDYALPFDDEEYFALKLDGNLENLFEEVR